jgi:hypothetical protein
MTGEESPDNKEQRTSEREDVREGIAAEKKKTARLNLVRRLSPRLRPGKASLRHGFGPARPAFATASAGKGEKAG